MANFNELDVAFVTGLFPVDDETEIYSNTKGSMQNAANVLQWNLVKGLDENLARPIKLFNSLFIGSYPLRYKKLFVKSYIFSHTDGAKDENIGFCNFMGLKRFSRRYTINKRIKAWACDGKDNKILLAYAMTDSSVKALVKAKKVNPKVKTCLVVPDLPMYMNMSKVSIIYKALKSIDLKGIKKSFKYIDSYVLLTKQMAEFIGTNNYVVVEGVPDTTPREKVEKLKEKTVFYGGSLALKYGVGRLVEAFEQIENPDYRLVLCGSGDAEKIIKEKSEKDGRIKYLGLVPRAEVLRLQSSATVLVNPRQNDSDYTKFSFPSKIMEYLISETPLVAYKLDGMPDEYDEYINYVEDNSPSALAQEIIKACENEGAVYTDRALKAKKFILGKKNAKAQGEKILQLLTKQEDSAQII